MWSRFRSVLRSQKVLGLFVLSVVIVLNVFIVIIIDCCLTLISCTFQPMVALINTYLLTVCNACEVSSCVSCPGMDVVDFSLYPDRDYQLAWLRTFLELKFAESGRPASDVKIIDVERLYVQVNKFSLVSRNESWGHFSSEPYRLRGFGEQIQFILWPAIIHRVRKKMNQ